MFEEARALGDELVVIINNDNWLRAKKGYAFLPEEERAELIGHFPFVDRVVLTKHPKIVTDRSVCDALDEIRPNIFANGGDRFADNVPEYELCTRLGIEMIFNIGGGKIQSSSVLVKSAHEALTHRQHEWGIMRMHDAGKHSLFTLHIEPGACVSLGEVAPHIRTVMLLDGDATVEGGTDTQTLAFHVPLDARRDTSTLLCSKNGAALLVVPLNASNV